MLLLASNQLTFTSSANQIIAEGSKDKETGYGTDEGDQKFHNLVCGLMLVHARNVFLAE
ncbi:hypothetical protein RHGRI_024185 [Rhododendron griersonianum]|uniref:Uncharacterized protein n=1 Tax=Rhododendron griersonianum TaxID=479676 RepID=A0AAV6J8D5_9ERIC|nr:hypothetical protein RHGRI_024185 [Rhododendron griersonianum]